jgi:hypothetical protein
MKNMHSMNRHSTLVLHYTSSCKQFWDASIIARRVAAARIWNEARRELDLEPLSDDVVCWYEEMHSQFHKTKVPQLQDGTEHYVVNMKTKKYKVEASSLSTETSRDALPPPAPGEEHRAPPFWLVGRSCDMYQDPKVNRGDATVSQLYIFLTCQKYRRGSGRIGTLFSSTPSLYSTVSSDKIVK